MKPNERLLLMNTLNEIKTVANEKYNGELYENIYEIFMSLSVSKRMVLLKEFTMICFIADQESLCKLETIDEKLESTSTAISALDKDIKDVEKLNTAALVGLKVWFAKALFICSVIAIIVSAALIAFSTDKKVTDVIGGGLNNLFSIFKIVLGGG